MKCYPSVYEINTRVWIKRFGAKSLKEIPNNYWSDLKNKGIDYVWLMGVWKTCDSIIEKYCFEEGLVKSYGQALKDWKKEDVIGSPFAIDKYEVNPVLGGNEALVELREKLKEIKLGLILDFVPNHYSVGSSLLKTNPGIFLEVNKESYERDSHTYFKSDDEEKYFAHGRDPFFPAWQDTIQVNYFGSEAREFQTNILLKLADLCDGVRCDMAMLMLNNVFRNTWAGVFSERNFEMPAAEFWKETIEKVKENRSDFLFIAEAYWDLEWELHQHGFDFTYEKKLTDRLRFGNVNSVRDHLYAENDYQQKSVRFLENHDETRSIAALGKERAKAAAVLMNTIQGMRFFNDGQFEGKKIKMPVQLGREPFEAVRDDIKIFYDNLLSIAQKDIFKRGKWQMLDAEQSWEGNYTFNNLLISQWTYEKEKCVVIINYSDIVSTCRIKLDVSNYPEEFEIIDLLNDTKYIRSAEEVYHMGLYVELKPWQSHMFYY